MCAGLRNFRSEASGHCLFDKTECPTGSSSRVPLEGYADRVSKYPKEGAEKTSDRQILQNGNPRDKSCQAEEDREIRQGAPNGVPGQQDARHRFVHKTASLVRRYLFALTG